jgi:hypothetical protein
LSGNRKACSGGSARLVHDGKWGFRVIFVILIYYAFLLLPLGLFLAAAVAEIRSYQEGPAFFLRMVEIVAGIIGVLAIPSKFGAHRLFLPGHCPISASNLRNRF